MSLSQSTLNFDHAKRVNSHVIQPPPLLVIWDRFETLATECSAMILCGAAKDTRRNEMLCVCSVSVMKDKKVKDEGASDVSASPTASKRPDNCEKFVGHNIIILHIRMMCINTQ